MSDEASEASEARQVLSALRDRPVSVDSERLAARRARVIGSIEREASALGAGRRQRTQRRAAGVALAVAASVGLAFGAQRLVQRHGPPSQVSLTFVGSIGQTLANGAESPRTLRAGEALSTDPGEIHTASSGSAELVSNAGLGLRLGSETRLSLAALLGPEAKNQVALQQGTLTCSVPHLQEGQRFSVQTPDARVVVHGTVFSVHVDTSRAAGGETCVEVTDGVVIVQHGGSETALNAGDRWGCASVASDGLEASNATDTAAPEAPVEDRASDTGSAPASTLLKPSPRLEHGTLSEERRLFQRALAAERLGQRDHAQALINQLLSKYPSSPLAPEARRALSRIASSPVPQ